MWIETNGGARAGCRCTVRCQAAAGRPETGGVGTMRDRWERLSTLQKVGLGAVVVIGAPSLIAGMVAGAKDSSGGDKAAATATSSAAATSGAPKPAAGPGSASPPGPLPTFTYPGGPQCVITYRAAGDGAMSWTAVTTVAGKLITHATDRSGTVYRHSVHAAAGRTVFTATVPLAEITDLGGNLDAAGGKSYGCSVGPAR